VRFKCDSAGVGAVGVTACGLAAPLQAVGRAGHCKTLYNRTLNPGRRATKPPRMPPAASADAVRWTVASLRHDELSRADVFRSAESRTMDVDADRLTQARRPAAGDRSGRLSRAGSGRDAVVLERGRRFPASSRTTRQAHPARTCGSTSRPTARPLRTRWRMWPAQALAERNCELVCAGIRLGDEPGVGQNRCHGDELRASI
jgi:hypothetical protein